jgi:hypothetical protein
VATVVDWSAVLMTVAASFIAGVGITLVFSVAIFSAARFADVNRDERPVAAVAYAALAIAGLIAVAAAVAFGIIVMASK